MPDRPPDVGPSRPGAASLVLYVRQGCHLCDQFLVELSLELGAEIERLQVIDVDRDPDLAVRYGLRVPVLEVRGELLCEAVLDARRLGDALRL